MKKIKALITILALAIVKFADGQQSVTVLNNGSGTGTFNTPGVNYYLAGPAGGVWDFSNVTTRGVTATPITFGVSQILPGSNISVSPTNGEGIVTVTATGSGGTPGGSTTQMQYNNAGAFGGTSGLIWNNATFALKNTQNVAGLFNPLLAQNQSGATNSATYAELENDAGNQLVLALTGSNYSGSWIGGGPSGQQAFIGAAAAIPLVFGDNNLAAGYIDTSQVWHFTNPILVEGANTVPTVATIAALKALSVTPFLTGQPIQVAGYYSAGDGGGGLFTYNSSSAASDNGGTIIAPTVGSGRWLRPSSATFYTVQFGVKADNSTDNTATINATLAAALASLRNPGLGWPVVEFMPGPTVISTANDAIVINGPIIIHGNGAQLEVTSPISANVAVQVTGFNAEIHDLYVNCPNYSMGSPIANLTGIAFQGYNLGYSSFYNCYANGFAKGYQFIGDGQLTGYDDIFGCYAQNNLIGMEFNTTAAGGGSITSCNVFGGTITIGAFSSMTGSKDISLVTTTRAPNGINFYGTIVEGNAGNKLSCYGDHCSFNDCYWDQSNGGTDIYLDSTSAEILIQGGANLDLMAITNSGTDNAILDPKNGFTFNVAKITGTTASSSTTTGAITDAGGLGVVGAIYAGSLQATPIGATTPSSGAFTTVSATGQITSTLAIGTPPLVVTSTTNVANLNASSLGGATFASPGAIGGGSASTGNFTTMTANLMSTGTTIGGSNPGTIHYNTGYGLYLQGATGSTADLTLASVGNAVVADVPTGTKNFALGGIIPSYNGITTAGQGVAVVVASANITAQSAAATITSYVNGAADADFDVSAQMSVTASTTLVTTITCTYTDVANVSRSMIMPVQSVSGTFVAAGAITGAGASIWETPTMHIRAKASSTITLLTSTGTFTGITYSASGIITELN